MVDTPGEPVGTSTRKQRLADATREGCGMRRACCASGLATPLLILDLRPVWQARPSCYVSAVTDTTRVEVTVSGVVESLTVLQAVADPVRWTVLAVLAQGPRCVCSLQEQIPVAGNLLSYHLKVLREAGLITSSRRGRWVDYALADDAPGRMTSALPGVRTAVTA
jgi:ArsR family transcriptional regulator